MYNGKKILIIEDENDISDFMKSRLEYHNFNVTVANNGEKGWDLVKEVMPDVVVLELILDKMNGFTVCRKIRENLLLRSLKIIILTSVVSGNVQKEAYKIGANAFIAKPYDPDHLLFTIDGFLGREIAHEITKSFLSQPWKDK